MMSTCCSKHVEAWNKYIKRECVKLVTNQNYVKMDGQQNIKNEEKYLSISHIHVTSSDHRNKSHAFLYNNDICFMNHFHNIAVNDFAWS
jgi:hypothetical protein